MHDLLFQYLAAGLGVGFVVGLTGVGGGSLMTPLLVFLFGQPASVAVGTDLLFAAGTKASGTLVHHKHSAVDWRIVRLLCLGSLPAATLTLVGLWATHSSGTRNGWVLALLGVLVFATGLQALGLLKLPRWGGADLGDRRPALVVVGGAVLGFLVALTSIGAGVLGTVLLRALFPRLKPSALVGTDLAHAIPLTLVAGAGYLAMGSIDFHALGWLLLGSTPGVILGSLLSSRLDGRLVGKALGVLLLVIGAKTMVAALT